MATTYGYSGEFSSDEDIDRLEQQAERLTQAKFDSHFGQAKPSKSQIEKAIETIKRAPIEQDFTITDDLLASLLDHYKTARGPIVDSTRNLYKKIVLRLIRGEQSPSNGEQVKESNGSSNLANNNNNNDNDTGASFNNNNNKTPAKRALEGQVRDLVVANDGSSDEDEPMPPVTSQSSQDAKIANLFPTDKPEPMDVDSEQNLDKQIYRSRKQEEGDSGDDDDSDKTESSSDEDDQDDDDKSSDSEVIDVTPIKSNTANHSIERYRYVDRQVESSTVKKQPPSRQKQSTQETTPLKKPYTRSQRVAATRASSAIKSSRTDVSSSKADALSSGDKTSSADSVTNKSSPILQSVMQPKVLIPSALVVLIAVLLFFFRSDLSKATSLLSPSIKF